MSPLLLREFCGSGSLFLRWLRSALGQAGGGSCSAGSDGSHELDEGSKLGKDFEFSSPRGIFTPEGSSPIVFGPLKPRVSF